MLMHMVKSAVIFSDRDKPEKSNYPSTNKDVVTFSRGDYRRVIDAAYQEGRNDVLKEQKQKESKKDNKADLQQKGKEEAIRTHAKEKEQSIQRFKTITARHEIEIMRAQSVFPFTFFTDTLIIDTTKVSVAKKQLYATEFITTIPLKDLSDINVQTVLFLGTLIIKYMPQSSSPGMNEPVEVRIANLPRKDAIKAKNILKGVLVAKAEEIDIAKLPPEEVVKVLQKIGESSGVI